MIHLNNYGWNDKLSQLKQKSTYNALTHGRISIVHRTCYEVVSENGLFQCELTGNMMYGKSDFELPCTGDWVLFQPFDEHNGIIVDMLPRERTLYRKKNGTVADKQAIASYVDKAFIVQSLDDNFNVRRAERFMVQMQEENINPVLVFNKADLIEEEQKDYLSALLKDFPKESTEHIFISAKQRENTSELQKMLISAAHLPTVTQNDIIVTNVRHYEALSKASDAIHRVQNGLDSHISGDFLSQDIRECIFFISDIAGEVTNDMVLQNIFQHFCIGK